MSLKAILAIIGLSWGYHTIKKAAKKDEEEYKASDSAQSGVEQYTTYDIDGTQVPVIQPYAGIHDTRVVPDNS